MMKTNKIFKQTLAPWKTQFETFVLPKGAVILSFQIQNNNLVFWYQFDVEETIKEKRTFIYALTGQPFHYNGEKYLTTLQMSGDYVIHIYETLLTSN